MNVQFGTGLLYGAPLITEGNPAANPTPYNWPVLQDASVEFKGDLKKLYGQKQFPVAKARGKIDVSCKAKLAAFDAGFMNNLYFGQAQTAGIVFLLADEVDVIPGTPFEVTVANAGEFVANYGVTKNGVTMEQLQGGSVATGQYKVDTSTGVYTFAAADTGLTVKISYSYTITDRGLTTSLANQLMGYAPEFQAFLINNFRGVYLGIQLNDCTMGQLSIATKQEDFWMADITFDACTDVNDVLGAIYSDI